LKYLIHRYATLLSHSSIFSFIIYLILSRINK